MNLLPASSFLSSLISTTQRALSTGALISIPTRDEYVRDQNLTFLLRVLAQSREREAAATLTDDGSAPAGKTNPFLPYEPDLYVGHFNDSYVCLLNKFNVLPNHFLVVTSTFQEQDSQLTLQDFEVALEVLARQSALVFFNGGKLAGASQRHKHLQAIPYSDDSESGTYGLANINKVCPLYEMLCQSGDEDGLPQRFSFLHRLNNHYPTSAGYLHQIYRQWIRELKLAENDSDKPSAYNLLMTREWIMIVPRKQEHFAGMSVNALGFAGTLLAKTPKQLMQIRDTSPMNLLKAVTLPSEYIY
ncbi:ATP adenylyltransferase family protein [Hahella ganghwensis]|uniref:ATP adenylyltransferase family protein n=1 Tax=Hahella ganghwensis TaxID=286420 RepID=UPI000367D3AB|nr:DUF4922 domain-containing protein [Hahella ganghwensis]